MSTDQQQMQGLDHFWQEPWTQDTWMSTLSQNPAAQGLQPAAWTYTSEFIGFVVDSGSAGIYSTMCLSWWEVTSICCEVIQSDARTGRSVPIYESLEEVLR